MRPKVSVIVPVYNTDKWLSSCLSSIMKQTISDIEIIAINDCSTDNSLDVLKSYERKDKRIKVISNPSNLGVSETRNIGLSKARGEYIGFIDADDWIDTSMYQKMYKAARTNNADIVMCNMAIESNSRSIANIKPIRYGYYDRHDIESSLFPWLIGPSEDEGDKWKYFCQFSSVCTCIYRRDFLRKHLLNFVSRDEVYSEDHIFNMNAFWHAKSIFTLQDTFYHARKHSSSFSAGYCSDYVKMRSKHIRYIRSFLIHNNLYNKFKARLDGRLYLYTASMVQEICRPGNDIGYSRKIEQIRNLISSKKIRDVYKNVQINNIPLKYRLPYKLILHKYPVLLYLYYTYCFPLGVLILDILSKIKQNYYK